MPVLGTDLAIHLGIELGINLAGVAVVPPVVEPPALLTGLKAWFDSRDTAYFALGGGGEVSGWISRAGSLGAIAWQQGTAANQPVRVAVEPLFNNQPAVRFDGVNDWLVTSNQAAWTFLHDGTGQSIFRVFRLDSTGGATQTPLASQSIATAIGIAHHFTTTILALQVTGGAPAANNWNIVALGHRARDVARWQMTGHGDGSSHSRVSGSNLANPDTGVTVGGLSASALRMGVGVTNTNPIKGHIVQDIYYDHVLSAGELATLTAWAAPLYGIAA